MWVGAATGLAKQRAAQAAADTVATDPDVQNYTPAEQSSVKSLVLNGTPLAEAKSQIASERMTAAKTGGALGAQAAATSAALRACPARTPRRRRWRVRRRSLILPQPRS